MVRLNDLPNAGLGYMQFSQCPHGAEQWVLTAAVRDLISPCPQGKEFNHTAAVMNGCFCLIRALLPHGAGNRLMYASPLPRLTGGEPELANRAASPGHAG